MYLKKLLPFKLETLTISRWILSFMVLVLLFGNSESFARNIEANEYFCNHSKLTKTTTKKTSAACSISVVNVTEQNCTGAGTYTAEWSIDIAYADAPIGDIMIQRGTETPVAFATGGVSPESFTLTGVPADGMADSLTVYFANEIACTNKFYLNRPLACPANLSYPAGDVCNNLQSTEIGGTVFYDSNYDGTYDLGSVNGIIGVAVTAYNNKGAVAGMTYTDNNGNYVFTGMTDENYRIEFVLPTAISSIRKVTHSGTEDRTTVQFKRPGDCASLGIAAPADFCDGVPWIAVPCYNYGATTGPNAGGDAFVTFPIDTIPSSTPSSENMLSMPNVRHLATHEDVGVTYGVAYSQTRQAIYTSAYMKRHSAFGPDGTGAIYAIDPSGNKQTTTLVDLNTIFGAGTAGVDPHDYVDGDPCPGSSGGVTDCWFNDVGADSLSWYSVGRISFGDIEITDDENTLYAMNMADRRLYKIPLDNPSAANIQAYPFPLNQDTDPNVTHTCGDPANSIRPMGLAWKDGRLYVGATCTDFVANSSAPYEGGSVIYVYEFDPFNETWTLVLNSDIQRNSVEQLYNWRDYSQDYYANPGDRGNMRSFMILSDIEFEGDTMVLGTRDMVGDLLGYNTGWPVPDETELEKYHCVAGDILRTCPQGDGTWKIENSADCAGGGINNPANPCPNCGIEGLGSYYYGDWINNVYVETSLGGLAEWPGAEKVFMASFDPLDISLTQGMSILNHRTGEITQAYNLGATDFGKVAGLGDIEMICAPAPLMIGNRIWLDQNGDGIQTPGEPGIGGIAVALYTTDGTQVAEVKTDANGNYYFKDEDLTAFNNGKIRLLNPSTAYYVAVGIGQFNTTTETLLNNYKLTSINTGEGAYPTMNDSDGEIAVGVSVSFNGYPYSAITTGVDGTTANSLDFGFVPLRNIGDLVWIDEDGDGVQDRGESGIPGVKMELKNQGGTLVATTYTDMNGEYLFRGIDNGTYTVELDETTLPSGLDHQTFDPDGTLDAEHTILSTTYFEYLNADFGYNWVVPSTTDNPVVGDLGAIGDLIWHDINGDGIWNPGERGIPNVEVALYQDNDLDGVYDDLVNSVQTDVYGRYIIENLPTGAYVILVDDTTLPVGYTTTPTGDPDQDTNSRSLPFVLAPGDVLLTLDFGYQNPTSYAVSGNIFIDLNAGGTKESGEPAVPNVTVKLMNAVGTVIATTMADANGDYAFEGLSNGNYTIMITDINTVLTGFSNTADPDAGTTNEAEVIISNSSVIDQDFGYVPEGHTPTDAIIGNFVFLDMNANGSYQADEPGLEGVIVSLIDTDNNVLATAETNENGQYFFGGLAAADYKVAIVPSSLAAGLVPAYDPDGGAPVDFESTVITLAAGSSNMLQDFGVKTNFPHVISGTVWEDYDAEGDLDESNTGIENVTIVLMDDLSNVIATTMTNSTGDYSFSGLPVGMYLVNVSDEGRVLSGYWHSEGVTPGADNNSQTDTYSVTVVGGISDQTGDFGYYKRGASIGNYVWSDRNSDGLQDTNEKGVEGVLMTLKIDYDGNGTTEVSMVTTSDIDGAYRFDNLLLDEDYNKAAVTGPAFELQMMTLPAAYAATTVDVNGNVDDMEDSEDHTGVVVDPRQGTTDVSLKADPTTEDIPATYDFGLQFDCTSPTVEYAMTLDGSTNAGQTTDYFYMDSIELANAGMAGDGAPSSDGGHVAMTQQHGRIQTNDYCEYGTWRYYFNPQDVDEYLFAVEMGTNVTEIDYIEIRVDDNSTDRHIANANDAAYVMQRDWKLKTVNDAPFLDAVGDPTTVNIRFYFPPNEYKEMLDAAIAQAIAWPADGGAPNSTHVRWFRKTTFDPDTDIDVLASNLFPNNVTSLRNAASDNAGVNTADNTPTIGNAKNHIQFNGLDMPSAGTAFIQINRTALPVELISFEGISEGCDVMLNWRSASELSFSHYELERSSDGARFEPVTTIEGSVEGIDVGYQYFDTEAAPRNYYRLKMVDVDGQFDYSNIVIVETDCNNVNADWMIYPNPLSLQSSILNVKFYTEEPSVKIAVFNTLQQRVKALELDVDRGWNTLEWDMSELPAGTYYIRNSRSDEAKSYKFVLVR